MCRDRLLQIEPGFEDPAHPGQLFVCPDCNAIEGLLEDRFGFPRLHR
jgi:hypothetical protein